MSKVYDVINKRIMELLEQVTISWKKPWNAEGKGSLDISLEVLKLK